MDEPVSPSDLDRQLQAQLPALQRFLQARAHRGIRQHESISDLMQSVCREALEQRGRVRFSTQGELRAWLFELANCKLVDRDRYRGAAKRSDRRTAQGLDESGLPGREGTPSALVSQDEQAERITAALARLDEAEFRVISLHRYHHRSHAEIAVILGKTEVAVRKMLSRAQVRLAQILRQG